MNINNKLDYFLETLIAEKNFRGVFVLQKVAGAQECHSLQKKTWRNIFSAKGGAWKRLSLSSSRGSAALLLSGFNPAS